MISANQLYKQSGSELSFKEWLNIEQSKGNLIPAVKEDYHNYTGESAEQLKYKRRTRMLGILSVGLIALGVASIYIRRSR